MALVIVRNEPEISKAFRDENVQNFLRQIFREFDNGSALKSFLKLGWEASVEEQFKQLAKSFVVVEPLPKKDEGYKTVERCLDGAYFSVGEKVVDLLAPLDHPQRVKPIGRLYEDDRGLHVRLDYPDEGLTWRDLSTIEKIESKNAKELMDAINRVYSWMGKAKGSNVIQNLTHNYENLVLELAKEGIKVSDSPTGLVFTNHYLQKS